MLKKTITYTNFNDETVSEDFFFHLSKAELVELEMSEQGGLSVELDKIIKAEDGKAIIAHFKDIILGAYGVRSDDGKRFVKNQTLRDEFESTEAYSVLFMELVTDADAAAVFVNGIIPEGMADEVAKLIANKSGPVAVVEVPKPEPKVVSRALVQAMTKEELDILGVQIASGEVILGE